MKTIYASHYTSASALVTAIADAGEIVTVRDCSPSMRESMSAFITDAVMELDGSEGMWGVDDDGRDWTARIVD